MQQKERNLDNELSLYSHVFKVVLIGNTHVGKTNLLTRYRYNTFTTESTSTIGVEFSSKVFKINNETIQLQIWDTAGQERFRSVTRAYYRGSYGAFIVYDIADEESFEKLEYWINDFKDQTDQNVVIMIIGNKSDLSDKRKISKEKGQKFAAEKNFLFMETSAKDGTNVHKAFETLITEIYNVFSKKKLTPPPINLYNYKEEKTTEGKCC
ncbi:ras-related protein rab-11a [Anaeramoeba ignava]|uniref:Ras-related protein rab-11a n=1 Tax=Anaeramoeba ignava TaxID=1746090 RepID=A0A9Q0LRN1_ANAIG|nr:ras-related protein rab-11a [Anaeramoeba ignava]